MNACRFTPFSFRTINNVTGSSTEHAFGSLKSIMFATSEVNTSFCQHISAWNVPPPPPPPPPPQKTTSEAGPRDYVHHSVYVQLTWVRRPKLGSCRISDFFAKKKGGVVTSHVRPRPPQRCHRPAAPETRPSLALALVGDGMSAGICHGG